MEFPFTCCFLSIYKGVTVCSVNDTGPPRHRIKLSGLSVDYLSNMLNAVQKKRKY